jgi:predicted ATPase
LVSLASIHEAALVLPTIAQALGIREGEGPGRFARLVAALQPQPVLLVLDNFEQVVGAASQVAELLMACPHLKVLVTSREVLHVRAEHEFIVPPLAVPDPAHLPALAELARWPSIALFLQRAQAVKPDFALTMTNASVVAAICVHLDGLPLAIELAAARMKLFSPAALLARLSQRLALLTSGARDVPPRQQTLRDTIAWSYHLLDAWEQRLFRWLSVFVGGWTLQAAEAVCATAGVGAEPVLEGMTSLVDKSLLQRLEHPGEDGEEASLRMLETIREYGYEALVAHGEEAMARQAHADYFCQVAAQAEAALQGPQLVPWLERLERAHDNLRAAVRWALASEQTALALRLGTALERFWVIRGHRSEGLACLERTLASSAAGATALRAKALLAAARLAFVQGHYTRGEILAQESLALFRELGDRGALRSRSIVWAQRPGDAAIFLPPVS